MTFIDCRDHELIEFHFPDSQEKSSFKLVFMMFLFLLTISILTSTILPSSSSSVRGATVQYQKNNIITTGTIIQIYKMEYCSNILYILFALVTYLESSLHMFLLEPEHYEGQHAETVEEGCGHHVHVEQSINISEGEEDNAQDSIEEETREGCEGVLVDIGYHFRQVTLSTGCINLRKNY